MKKYILIVFVAALFVSACKEKLKSTEPQSQALEDNYYKRLEGTIGGDAIVMNLNKQGEYIQGSYRMQGAEYNLMLDTLINDSLILVSYKMSDPKWDLMNSERLHLKWTGTGFTGKWISKNDQESLPVTLKHSYPAGTVDLETFVFVDSIKAYKDVKNSPHATLKLYFPVSKDAWLESELKKAMDSLGTGTWEDIAGRQFAEYKAYYEDQLKVLGKIDNEMAAFLNYYSGNNAVVKYNDKGYLVVDQFRDSYTGGAHGYYFSTFHLFDIQNQKKLALKDIIRADNKTLTTLLEKQIRIDKNIPEKDPIKNHLFVNSLHPSENYYFNDLGLAFAYHPYEIASYAEGQIVVLLPYSVIKQYLTPEFAKRMKLN